MTVRVPQLFHSADVANIAEFITDPAYALEQKVDGMRCMVVFQDGELEFLTRGGRPLRSAAAKLHFDSVHRSLLDVIRTLTDYSIRYGAATDLTLDAELITETGELVLLDMPYSDTYSIRPTDPYTARRDALEAFYDLFFPFSHPVIKLVTAARSELGKQGLVEEVIDKNLEGVIAKGIDSPYSEGERVKHSLKLKFTSTADVVVLAKNEGESRNSIRGGDKINYRFGLVTQMPGGTLSETLGNCSGIGKEEAEVGDIIEVEYLYLGAGGRLVQPRMLKLRKDKVAADCTWEQFRDYSKKVL